MEGAIYITAAEMAEMLAISKSYEYKLIKQKNEELDAKGFITILGKVAIKYFEEKFYGVTVSV
ncbi:DNA-binding protein [Anaeromicropila herbilytica]|uniref:Phage protein n=1 Tax=Anaeromicropila herbilytica TaxID=2785025 RepID=A0A7R7EPD7_9FIRM|nr:DNA-binding protein [Anaeromicropila herbilytica]BCN32610.1 phage protein [Anaeromicropila herbilytica]